MVRATWLFIFAAAMLIVGCGQAVDHAGSARVPTATATATNLQTFQVRGVVIEVLPREASIKIKHEEVPDYMPAMTMPFDVRDTNELAGLAAGDPVSFRLLVTTTEGWIDHLQKTGPKTNTPPLTGAFRPVRDVEPLKLGDVLPEYQFTNQFGHSFSTTNFAGQAVAIEFLFTRCPLPNFCPLLANNFEAAQRQLRALPNAPTNWQLLTISFDPEFDTPAVLKRYAEYHEYDPAHWTFATGTLLDVTAIGEQFGLKFASEEGSISHNLRAVVVDGAGRVRKIFVGNEWTADELTREMLQATRME
jgi:protein SCO1/2